VSFPVFADYPCAVSQPHSFVGSLQLLTPSALLASIPEPTGDLSLPLLHDTPGLIPPWYTLQARHPPVLLKRVASPKENNFPSRPCARRLCITILPMPDKHSARVSHAESGSLPGLLLVLDRKTTLFQPAFLESPYQPSGLLLVVDFACVDMGVWEERPFHPLLRILEAVTLLASRSLTPYGCFQVLFFCPPLTLCYRGLRHIWQD